MQSFEHGWSEHSSRSDSSERQHEPSGSSATAGAASANRVHNLMAIAAKREFQESLSYQLYR